MTLFLSHGSPMHALDASTAGLAWREIADTLPRPRAVLVASAHWETSLPMLTGRDRLETIHDFSGFPEALYRIRYDAPGAPAVAQRAASLLREAGYTPALDGCRGIDHGAWVPLKWMYPERDVPVVQVSVQPSLGTEHHLALGSALARLANEDVLVIGSGHATHNLRDWFTHRADSKPLAYVEQLVQKPHGIVLCAGPTGSGKTTTLHAILASINTDERKIWLAEEPIEITQDGLRQVRRFIPRSDSLLARP